MALPVIGPVGVLARDSISSFEDLPRDFREPALPVRTRVYAADGTKIATVFEENRKEVALEKVAPVMQQAVVAIEDSRFYEHNGFDPRGFLRAAVTNVTAGGVAQGGSTLTMQYVKNVLLTAAEDEEEQAAAKEDTITRKLREIRYAMALEKRLTKDEILERYLNISYYGARAYGVEAASQRYFSKSAKDLELVEAATLAGHRAAAVPLRPDPQPAPVAEAPRRRAQPDGRARLHHRRGGPGRQVRRRRGLPEPQGPVQRLHHLLRPLLLRLRDPRRSPQMKALGATPEEREAAWNAGGYKIYTTLDMKAQKAATKAVMEAIPPKDESRKATAIAMVTPGTGDIRAMAQNRVWGTSKSDKKWWETTYNYAVDLADGGTQGMQAGSTFKLFTIVAALEKGISPFTVINAPPRKEFTGFVGCNGDLLTGPDERRGRAVAGQQLDLVGQLRHVPGRGLLGEHLLRRAGEARRGVRDRGGRPQAGRQVRRRATTSTRSSPAGRPPRWPPSPSGPPRSPR